MGTRSLTRVFDEDENEIVCIYRQMDGYPNGHGLELAEFLEPITLVNGYQFNDPRKIANGMGCLAAQLVAHLKKEVGHIYIYPPGSSDCWEEYVYEIHPSEEGVTLSCLEADEPPILLFFGSPGEFIERANKEEET